MISSSETNLSDLLDRGPTQDIALIDYEVYYDEFCTIRNGTHNYLKHPDFDPYLVSIVCPSRGVEWVGHPKDAPWGKILDLVWGAHNAGFDEPVHAEAISRGDVPASAVPLAWVCTADLAAFLQAPRNLAGAAKALLGVSMSKDMRNWMKGKRWSDAVAAGKDKDLLQYALDDSRIAYRIWAEFGHRWPEVERRLSRLTRAQCRRGLHVDVPALEAGINTLLRVRHEAEQQIPWAGTVDRKGKDVPVLSAPAFRRQCVAEGLPVPDSLAKDDEDFEVWLSKYAEGRDWVKAVGVYRQSNAHLSRLLAVQRRLRPDSSIDYGMKYYGADTTGRWSGDSGLNMQNLPRKMKFGVNLRELFVAGPGHKFVVADLSQIEPRVLAYFAKDTDFLRLCAQGVSPYEAHAQATMGWVSPGQPLKDADADLYALCKVRVLQLGYGSGWATFINSAYVYGAQKFLQSPVAQPVMAAFETYLSKYSDDETRAWWASAPLMDRAEAVNAWAQVNEYRFSNTKITATWKRYEEIMRGGVGGDLDLRLPSGRVMRYFDVRQDKDGLSCTTELYGPRKRYYGAKLVENACQGLARDIFANRLLAVEDAGYATVLQVHDELVVRVPEADAAKAKADIQRIMRTPPPFMPTTFPLDSEVKITDRYTK
jgi:hypothetical protein